MDEQTARKYRDLGKLPSQTKPERTWKTRKDAFEAVWPEILKILERDESVEAKTIFDYLDRQGRLSIKLCLKGDSSALLKTRLEHGVELGKRRGDGTSKGSPAA